MKRLKAKSINASFEDAQLLNNATYYDYLSRMKKIATSMFEWVNLPSSMNARYLELCLYYKGMAALLYDDDYGFINTQAVSSGYINIYGLPTKINCFSFSYNEQRELYVANANTLKNKECILVMNTYDATPTCSTIELFAKRLAEAQRAADVNINAQKTPLLLLADKTQELTIRNVYAQIDGNVPAIVGDKKLLNDENIRSIKTEAPFVAKDIREYMTGIWNDFLSFIGITNIDEKRERLVEKEAGKNNELVNMNMQSYLIPRKQACKEFNEKFGLIGENAIDVRLRSDLYNMIKEYDSVVSDFNIKEEEYDG